MQSSRRSGKEPKPRVAKRASHNRGDYDRKLRRVDELIINTESEMGDEDGHRKTYSAQQSRSEDVSPIEIRWKPSQTHERRKPAGDQHT